jgi:hypothetical protein
LRVGVLNFVRGVFRKFWIYKPEVLKLKSERQCFYTPVENGMYYGMAILDVRLVLLHTVDNYSFCSFSHWWLDGFKWYLVYKCIMK